MKVKQHVYGHADGFAIGGGQNSCEHHLNPRKQKQKIAVTAMPEQICGKMNVQITRGRV
jgi:hypothetical protein